jgi:hypothetical protein
MIKIESQEQFEKAIGRARKGDLFVRFVRFRQFVVVNRATCAEYNVNFFVSRGRRFGGCDCKAGRKHLPCKHVAAALAVHLGIASMRRGH